MMKAKINSKSRNCLETVILPSIMATVYYLWLFFMWWLTAALRKLEQPPYESVFSSAYYSQAL